MSQISYALGIVAACLALIVVIEMLRKRKLRERHAIWWLFAGILALLIAVAPGTLEFAADALGILIPANLAFFLSILVLFFVGLQHSAELTSLEEKTRILAEETSLLRMKLSKLEEKFPEKS